ncbi:hypothetical protein [Bradyrhizobium liaoningense]|uniref:hypothetical protein n=1 Tax=Bradyrhizobium liaoningense TaxID=43992 RepID=UPI001BA86894|nr:hypothetical protein [Bradyrhizobium liaoningense]MBR0715353.1 hypothetical protein [Bradyrhizobium liaoningense]
MGGLQILSPALARARTAFETKAALSYAIVFLLVAKTVWAMWLYRDLTFGDTSSYFATAIRWAENFKDNILWSPLYTSFYGEMLRITQSAYGATNLHRIVIVFAAALGVLALMRRLMSPGMALLVALWWTVMPINFNTLYEVHLFALLPMLLVLVLACSATGPLHRGIILALLLVITALVRNETSIVLAVFAAFCAYEEFLQPFDAKPRTRTWWQKRLVGYAAPLAVAVALIAAFYAQSVIKYPQASAAAEAKHTLNMCQVYAFGYSQRHPEHTASPWTECQPLMKSTFGAEQPSLLEMLKANPAATLKHFAWNASLVVNGFQVALFNAMSGSVNPDYAPVQARQIHAAVLSVICVLLLLAGARRFCSDRSTMRAALIRHRHLLVVLVGLACTISVVVVTQRPRPSYLFAFTVCIMALVGLSADLLTQRVRAQVNAAALLVAAALILFLPFYQVTHASPRALYANLARLQPYQSLLAAPNNKLLIGDYAGELSSYLQYRTNRRSAVLLSFRTVDYSVLTEWDHRQPLELFLEERGFTAIFVQPRIMEELQALPASKALVAGDTAFRRLNPLVDHDWGLYVRPPSRPGG